MKRQTSLWRFSVNPKFLAMIMTAMAMILTTPLIATAEPEGEVTIVSGPEFNPSMSGDTEVVIVVRNDMKVTVLNVVVDLIIYTTDRKKSKDVNMRLPQGMLEPGASGEIRETIYIKPEQIAGHRVRVRFKYAEKVEPPKEGEELPDDVKHIVVPGDRKDELDETKLLSDE